MILKIHRSLTSLQSFQPNYRNERYIDQKNGCGLVLEWNNWLSSWVQQHFSLCFLYEWRDALFLDVADPFIEPRACHGAQTVYLYVYICMYSELT